MRIIHGDCIEEMKQLPDNSIDSICTDPPYGLGFMGKAWDALPPGREWAEECLRVLKPGGHLLAFGGTRTWHRLAVAVEDAGFEIRDSIAWLYGSGFPKSQNVALAIDKQAGARGHQSKAFVTAGDYNGRDLKAPDRKDYVPPTYITPEAQQWEGWGTALKPAFEPVVVARKPLDQKTVAANVLTHGTGALNIDASRIGAEERPVMVRTQTVVSASSMAGASTGATSNGETTTTGRFPANVILDEDQATALDLQSGTLTSGTGAVKRSSSATRNGNTGAAYGAESRAEGAEMISYGDTGGASRFFYCAKAPKSERPVVDGVAHATVKPLALMRYLVKLVTPPGGTTLDPFAGSGTTIEAALMEGFDVIGIEREAEYIPLIQGRIHRYGQSLL